jgi:hypothetical protein
MAANTLTNIMPKILSRGLLALRERCILPRLVNMDYGNEAAQKGTTIDVPISTAIATTDVTPSNVLPEPGAVTPALVQIQLDKWKKNTPFHLTDKELVEVDRNAHFVPMQVGEAIRGLANQVNQDIFAEYTGVANITNVAGDTLEIADIIQARKLLNQSNCPNEDRVMVVNHACEADLLAITAFQQWNAAGPGATENIQIRGEIGTRYGFTWYADDDCPTHTGGTSLGVGTPLIDGAHAVGVTTLSMKDSGSGATTLKAGDSFTIVGDTTYYVVTADDTASSGAHSNLSIMPPLQSAAADNAAVTFLDATASSSGTVGLAFHRDAFALATRPLMASASDMAMGSNIMSMTDPQTGLSLRLEVQRQYKQTTWEFDILYGVKCVRPEFACKVYTATDD